VPKPAWAVIADTPKDSEDRRPVALGQMPDHVSLFVTHTALDWDLAEHGSHGLPERLDPSITNSIPCSGSRPRSTRADSSAVATVAFSVEPSHSPSGIFTPSVVIPSATIIIRSFSSLPSIIITARRRSASWRLINSESASRVRSTNVRDTALFDVDRARTSTSLRAPVRARGHTGEHTLQHDPRKRVTIGEVLIRRKRHLGRAVRSPDPWPADLDAATAERDLAIVMLMPDSGPVRVPLPLRADDLIDFLLEHLAQDSEPDADAQREQALLRCPDQLAEHFLHALWKHGLIWVACATRTLLLKAVPPLDLGGSPITLPPGADGPEGPPSPQTSTRPGTTR
jgi:hypothetical protein